MVVTDPKDFAKQWIREMFAAAADEACDAVDKDWFQTVAPSMDIRQLPHEYITPAGRRIKYQAPKGSTA